MDDKEIKRIELEVQQLISLRSHYNTIVIVLTGGIVGLFYNLNTLNSFLLITGIVFDVLFLHYANVTTKRIKNLINQIGA